MVSSKRATRWNAFNISTEVYFILFVVFLGKKNRTYQKKPVYSRTSGTNTFQSTLVVFARKIWTAWYLPGKFERLLCLLSSSVGSQCAFYFLHAIVKVKHQWKIFTSSDLIFRWSGANLCIRKGRLFYRTLRGHGFIRSVDTLHHFSLGRGWPVYRMLTFILQRCR